MQYTRCSQTSVGVGANETLVHFVHQNTRYSAGTPGYRRYTGYTGYTPSVRPCHPLFLFFPIFFFNVKTLRKGDYFASIAAVIDLSGAGLSRPVLGGEGRGKEWGGGEGR